MTTSRRQTLAKIKILAIISTNNRVFKDKKEAEKAVKEIREFDSDDPWTYKVVEDPKSDKCIIGMYDEDGKFLGYYPE